MERERTVMFEHLSAQPCSRAATHTIETTVRWVEDDECWSALWRSANGTPPPAEVVAVDDRLTADAALRLAMAGKAMLWRGDFHGANQLLNALDRRLDWVTPAGRSPISTPTGSGRRDGRGFSAWCWCPWIPGTPSRCGERPMCGRRVWMPTARRPIRRWCRYANCVV
nr:hypothetical protein [Nocardia tengchongensis]